MRWEARWGRYTLASGASCGSQNPTGFMLWRSKFGIAAFGKRAFKSAVYEKGSSSASALESTLQSVKKGFSLVSFEVVMP